MTIGDILIAQDKIYLCYDKNLLLSAGLMGLDIKTINQIEGDILVLSIPGEIHYAKKKKLNDHLSMLISRQKKLDIKERTNFIKHINWIYLSILKIDILKHPALPITIENFIQSKVFDHETISKDN